MSESKRAVSPVGQSICVDTVHPYRLMLADGRPVMGVIGGGHAQPFTAQEKVEIAAHAVACWNAGVTQPAADIVALRASTQLCDKHQPKGGTRGMCVICAGERLQGALSRIDYACGEPNGMECSDYDVHMSEQAVVERVQAIASRVKVLEDAIALAYGHLWCINTEHGTPAPMRIPEAAAHDARIILLDLITKEQRGNGIDAARAELRGKP